ncbi:sugar ABC transporter substrate-binding protein [Pseudomonas fluorescens]|uniref:Sugar ABC transporter substrate-binding protein n=1 Tax=Pseudomonas fluorescens TaxID=294 RepID=A0A327NE66_PSEFL|nr:substrate-binding domain-containing protein [Pseudomonas fluorescens]RAI70868.1 sugar ABC transporter substrate-binding protein [Pseudomonas fluorescens]
MTYRISLFFGVAAAAALALSTHAQLASASDNRIALVPPGPHPYFLAWEKAAKDAQAEFGIASVDFRVPSERTLNRQMELLESLASQGYTGFGLSPGDPVGVNSVLQELKSGGIPSIAMGACPAEPSAAALCLSTDVYGSTYDETKVLINAIGGKGNIVHLAGLLVDPNARLRMDAVEKAIGETNGAVKLIQTIADTDNEEKADQKINALLGARKDQIDGIVASGYVQSTVAAKSLRNLGDKRIKLVGVATDKIMIDGIRDGFVVGTVGLNSYAEGYAGAYILDQLAGGKCTFKADAPFLTNPTSTHFVDSRPVFITSANVDNYTKDLTDNAKDITATFKAKFLNCP